MCVCVCVCVSVCSCTCVLYTRCSGHLKLDLYSLVYLVKGETSACQRCVKSPAPRQVTRTACGMQPLYNMTASFLSNCTVSSRDVYSAYMSSSKCIASVASTVKRRQICTTATGAAMSPVRLARVRSVWRPSVIEMTKPIIIAINHSLSLSLSLTHTHSHTLTRYIALTIGLYWAIRRNQNEDETVILKFKASPVCDATGTTHRHIRCRRL